MVMNRVHGLDQTGDAAAMPVGKEHCDDLDAARELLDPDDLFIMDVQQHHMAIPRWAGLCDGLRFVLGAPYTIRPDVCPEAVSQLNYVREVFVDSKTTIGVISGLPFGIPLGRPGWRDARPREPDRRLRARHLAGGLRPAPSARVDRLARPSGERPEGPRPQVLHLFLWRLAPRRRTGELSDARRRRASASGS
jgi:hypothetical protein